MAENHQLHPLSNTGPLKDIGKEARKKLPITPAPFNGRVFIIGCGAVAQSAIPLIPRYVNVPFSKVTIVDMVDTSATIKAALDAGAKFFVDEITSANHEEKLPKYVQAGDFLVDLAYEIPTVTLIRWCVNHNVMYMNTALEIEDPLMGDGMSDIREATLYLRHTDCADQTKQWGKGSPSCLIEHGMNPGLLSHFVSQGLVNIAEKIIAEKPNENPARTQKIKDHLKARNWGELSQVLGVKTIHIAERDTQRSVVPKKLNEFCNTWSAQGFLTEAVVPSEISWGTHEKRLPVGAMTHSRGLKHQICLQTFSMDTYVRSWVPTPGDSGEMLGMVIPHGETYTVAKRLSVYDDKGNCTYRPTVHYAYCPADAAVASLHELRMRNYDMQPVVRIMKDDIIDGYDIAGALIMGHDYGAWWVGSILDVHEARELVPGQNATTLQVGVGVVAAMQWMINHPKEGVMVADDLPYDELIQASLPYLGAFVSFPLNWNPVDVQKKSPATLFHAHPHAPQRDFDDTWQFSNFIVKM